MPRESFVIEFRDRGARALERAVAGLSRRMAGLGRAAANVGRQLALVGIAGIAGFAVALRSAAQATDEFAKAARRIETSVANIQALSEAAQISGTNLQDLLPSIERLSRVTKLFEGGRASKRESLALKILGFDPESFRGQGNLERFFQVVQALSRLGGAQRQLVGQELFGQRRFGRISNAINDLAGGSFEQARQRFARLGIDQTEAGARNTEAFNDALTRIGNTFAALAQKIAGDPAFLEAVVAFERALEDTIKAMGGGVGIAQAFAAALQRVVDVMNGLRRTGEGIGGGLFDLLNPTVSEIDARVAQ